MVQSKVPAVVVVGGAGLVGRVVVQRWKAKLEKASQGEHLAPKLISADLQKNPHADVSLEVDLREPSSVERQLFAAYDVQEMVIAVKPPLVGPSYQFFMEVNMAGLCELVALAERYKVRSLVYVSSFACCNHWVPHLNAAESDPSANPALTSLRSPYDLSKAVAEQFVLQRHSATGMRTVSIRIGGVYGDPDDQYWNRRLPFRLSLEISHQPGAPQIDSNYVENVAEGLLRVSQKLSEDASVGGRFYFYTYPDRRAAQQEISMLMAQRSGRHHLQVPFALIQVWLKVMRILSSLTLQTPSNPFNQPAGRSLEPKAHFSTYSMSLMGLINQTFDNTLFRKTFDFSHAFTTEEAIEAMVASEGNVRQTSRSYKHPSQLSLAAAGPLLLSVTTTALFGLCGGLSLSVQCGASESVCSLCRFCVVFSSPATHVFGFATQPTYKLWQPFRGGRLHVYLQGIGWSLFALMCCQWLLSFSWCQAALSGAAQNLDNIALLTDDRWKAAFGLFSQVLLGLSLLVFKGGRDKAKLL